MIYIDEQKKVFHLQTENTSYIVRVLDSLHLGQVYYGEILDINNEFEDLKPKHGIEVGSQVIYKKEDKTFNLNLVSLEMPTYGKGDFREPMLHIRFEDGSRTSDFLYLKHEIVSKPKFKEMPETKANNTNIETLIITLRDDVKKIEVDLHYSVFPVEDVITRRVVIRNESSKTLILEKALFPADLDITTKLAPGNQTLHNKS